MTYEDFKKKWFWRYLYETPGLRQLAGKIECRRKENTPSPNYPFEPVTLDLIEIPTWYGFKDDKQRRQYYR